MEYDFYTLGVLYLVYSFAGWVGETVVATVRGKHFANRGAAAGPFCFVYGSTAVLLAVGFTDLRSDPVYLFFACTLASTVMEWLTAKLLERLHRRKWWDYSGKRFNLNGYVCLQYSLLWGALGTATVLSMIAFLCFQMFPRQIISVFGSMVRSTLSSGILLFMLPTMTVTALSDTMATSPTMPLAFTRTFSPTCRGPLRKAEIFFSIPALSSCCDFPPARPALRCCCLCCLSLTLRIFSSK